MDSMTNEEIYKIVNDLRVLRNPDVLCRNAILAIEDLLEQRDIARWEMCSTESELAMHDKVSTSPEQIAEEYGWNYLNEIYGDNNEPE